MHMNVWKSVLRNVGGGCNSSVSVPTVPFHTLYGFNIAAMIGFLRSASDLSLVPIFILEHESGITYNVTCEYTWNFVMFHS